MKRAFVWVDGRQVHYRTAGRGPAVVLLHPSPLSSAAVWPVAAQLAEHFQVFALDTPGYGQSQPLATPPGSLANYLPVLAATLDALGLQRVCLYGCATGAQIAIEFSKVYPQRVELLVLDTAGHIGAEECEQIVRAYFPDVTPQSDGRHLVTLWQMVRDLFVFFPWCDTRCVSRIARDLPPPAVMQGMLLDYLRAGASYHLAYRPAFYNERAERAQAVTVPTVLTRWAGSIALRITDDLIAAGLPANFSVLPLEAPASARFEGIARYVREHYSGEHFIAMPASTPMVSQTLMASDYLDTESGQLHFRARRQGGGRPLLLLHDVAGSSAVAEAWMTLPHLHASGVDRPLLAFDLPGHGESVPAEINLPAGPAQDAELIHALLKTQSVSSCDVLAFGSGALTAAALAGMSGIKVNQIRVVDERTQSPSSAKAPDFSARPDGTHLLTAWYWLRDQALWQWPNVTTSNSIRNDEPAPRLAAELLQVQLTELMKIGPRLAFEWAAVQTALRPR